MQKKYIITEIRWVIDSKTGCQISEYRPVILGIFDTQEDAENHIEQLLPKYPMGATFTILPIYGRKY